MEKKRLINLDLFRAVAISFVIFFHVSQTYFDISYSTILYSWGKYGVEFFFVLSGFLVGGLYYREEKRVNLFRFWFLRICRTYFPYLVALLFSYAAVYFARSERFDFGYLLFVQNFYHKIPYFLISWSLCVEEHFYVVFPVFIIVLERIIIKPKYQLYFWIFLSLLPTFLRFEFGNPSQDVFGYNITASIFRFDGIAMGCLLSFVVYRLKYKPKFSFLSTIGIWMLFLSALSVNIFFSGSNFIYSFGYLFLNVSLFLLLANFYFSKDFKVAKYIIIYPLASMAYSLYLTHAMVINFMAIIAIKFNLNFYLKYFLTFAVILIVGFIFYRLIELPTIKIRNYYFEKNNPGKSIINTAANHLKVNADNAVS